MKKKNLFLLLLIIGLLIFYNFVIFRYADFVAINGDFQNYNPIRRLLDGQIPYKTFTDYLGLGHLFLGSFFTFIFGNTLLGSMKAFGVLSSISFILCCYIISNAIFQDKTKSLYLTLLALSIAIFLNNPIFNCHIPFAYLQLLFNSIFKGGNSARLIRGMIIPLSILIVIGLKKILTKKWPKNQKIIELLAFSITSSVSFLWSNDFGISAWLCLLITYTWILISRRYPIKQIIKYFFSFLGISVISIILLVNILTLGNMINWLKSFLSTGDYQGWYYNSYKSHYWYDIELSLSAIIQGIITIYYLIKVYREKGNTKTIKRDSILLFINMTSFCAANEYKLLSGNKLYEMVYITLGITIVCEILFFIKKKLKKEEKIIKICQYGILAFSLIIFIFTAISEYNNPQNDHERVYVKELGGYTKNPSVKYNETKEFLNGDKVFSLYASAIEVVTNQYQPSGIDYIIHVLGDNTRESYLDSFKKDDFKYVATIKDNYSLWEQWIRRANWFFYRELYRDYIPVYANEYELFWEKKEEIILHDNYKVTVTKQDKEIKIEVNTEKNINGIAEVLVSYETISSSNPLLFHKLVSVKNNGRLYQKNDEFYETYNLREKGEELIPVNVINGHGEIILKSLPEASTNLKVYNATCSAIYPIYFSYVIINEVKEENNELVITLEKDNFNDIRLNNANKIIIDNYEVSINKKTINFDQESDLGSIITVDYDTNLKELLKKKNVIILK